MAKNKVHIDVKRFGPGEVEADKSFMKEAIEKAEVKEVSDSPCRLVSRADHPLDVKYGDSVIVLSPRQRVELANLSKLDRASLSPLITVITQ